MSFVEFSPVSVEFMKNREVRVRISAKFANFKASKRVVIFKGDVSLESGKKTLKTRRLYFLPRENKVLCEDKFVIITPRGIQKGYYLFSDPYLTHLCFERTKQYKQRVGKSRLFTKKVCFGGLRWERKRK